MMDLNKRYEYGTTGHLLQGMFKDPNSPLHLMSRQAGMATEAFWENLAPAAQAEYYQQQAKKNEKDFMRHTADYGIKDGDLNLRYIAEQRNLAAKADAFHSGQPNPASASPGQLDGRLTQGATTAPMQGTIPQDLGAGARQAPAMAGQPSVYNPPVINTQSPVLDAQASQQPVAGQSAGILNQDTSAVPSRNNGNARGSKMGYAKVGMGESMIRLGGALAGSADKPFGVGQKALGDEYSRIMNTNRDADDKATAQQAAIDAAALRASASAKATAPAEASEEYGLIGQDAAGFRDIIGQLKVDDYLTGPVANLVAANADMGGFLGEKGVKRANTRLKMEGIALNEQMMYIANTKGAITDREMAMFRRPIPQMTADEGVWILWLEERADVMEQLATNGISDAASAKATGNAGPKPKSQAAPFKMDQETEDLVNKILGL